MVDILTTGAINWDTNLFVKEIECSAMEMPVERITRVPGGKAANVAVASARLLGKNRCGILGSLGDDEIGRLHLKIFEHEGVDTRGIFIANNMESGQAHILVDATGKNKIYTHFGANASLNDKLLQNKVISELVEEATILVAMDPPIPYTKSLFEKAKGKKVIWAPGVRTLISPEQVMQLLGLTSYLVLNEEELFKLTGKTDPEKGFFTLAANSNSLRLIVTMGEDGAVLFEKGKSYVARGIKLGEAGFAVVNTVGCGDAFIGCFAASIAEGMDDVSALERANYAGAYKATKHETRGSPTKEELDEFIHILHDSDIA
ncbi:MAG: carbohydrate kinase family protein [Nitrososphaerota archaeon]